MPTTTTTPPTRDHAREFSGFRHILTTIKATAKTMVIAALCCAVLGIAVVEVYAYIATGTASLMATHVLAVVIGLVFAYGAVVTVLLRGVIATVVDSIELVAAEIERLTNSIVHQVETVEGAVFHHDHDHDEYQGYGQHYEVRKAVGSWQ